MQIEERKLIPAYHRTTPRVLRLSQWGFISAALGVALQVAAFFVHGHNVPEYVMIVLTLPLPIASIGITLGSFIVLSATNYKLRGIGWTIAALALCTIEIVLVFYLK